MNIESNRGLIGSGRVFATAIALVLLTSCGQEQACDMRGTVCIKEKTISESYLSPVPTLDDDETVVPNARLTFHCAGRPGPECGDRDHDGGRWNVPNPVEA